MRYQIIPVTPFQQNCTLLWCEQSGEAAFIDPGGEVQRLIVAAAAQAVTVTQILLTHAHLDHVGGAEELAAHFQVPILGPQKADIFLLKALPEQCHMFGFIPIISAFSPTRWLAEGEIVLVGQHCLSVLHCPGHTPGHVAFFCQAAGVVWSGDVLFHGSIGRTDLPGGDFATLQTSIHEKFWPLGDNVTFIPGHGTTSTIGYERRHNPFIER